MKKLTTLFVSLIFGSALAFSQGENDNWVFRNLILNFNHKDNSVNIINKNNPVYNRTNPVSNRDGKLLFYESYNFIYDINNNITDSLDNTAIGNHIILPHLANDSLYYLFFLNQKHQLNNYTIDMSKNNGLGKVVSKETLAENLYRGILGDINYLRHANGRDIWLVMVTTRSAGDEIIYFLYSYLITKNGVSKTTIINEIIKIKKNNGCDPPHINICTSKRNNLLLFRNYSQNINNFIIVNFNNKTGAIDNVFNKEFENNYGNSTQEMPAFTLNGKYFYFDDQRYEIVHWDNKVVDIKSDGKRIFNTSKFKPWRMRDDGKIYTTFLKNDSLYLAVVLNPEAEFRNLILVPDFLNLKEKYWLFYELPEIVPSRFNYYIKAAGNSVVCEGDSISLSFETDLLSDSLKWIWSFGGVSDTSRTIVIKNAKKENEGWYYITADAFGYIRRDSIYLKVAALEPVNLTASKLKPCENEVSILSSPNKYYKYEWSTGDTVPSIKATKSGEYRLKVYNEYGCFAEDSIQIEFLPVPDAKIKGPDFVCSDEDAFYEAEGDYIFEWHLVSGRFTRISDNKIKLNTSSPGKRKIILKALNKYNCADYDTFEVTVNAPVQFNIAQEPPYLCSGSSIKLKAPEGMRTYRWSTGDTLASIVATKGMEYSVEVTDNFGCKGFDTIIVIEHENPLPQIVGSEYFCKGNEFELAVDKKYVSYLWSDNSTNEKLQKNIPGRYWCEVTDSFGCKWRTPEFEIIEYDVKVDVSSNFINYGEVDISSDEDALLNIYNNSSIKVSVNDIRLPQGFELVRPKAPFDIPPMTSQSIQIKFKPSAEQEYSGEMSALVEPCSKTINAVLQGKGVNEIELTAYFPDTSAFAGWPLCIPVYGKANQDITADFSIHAAIPYDLINIPAPVENSEAQFYINGTSKFTVEGAQIGSICGTILLPGRLVNELKIKKFEITGPSHTFTQDGTLKITGVCSENLRLIESFNQLELSVNPNPSTGDVNIKIKSEKDSKIDLRVYDVRGAEIFSNSFISAGENAMLLNKVLPQGDYQIVVASGLQIKTVSITVVK